MDTLVWDAVIGSIQDQQLAEGLQARAKLQEATFAPKRQRLASINAEIEKALRRIRNLATAIGNADDDDARVALETEQKRAGQQKQNLALERERLVLEFAEVELTQDRQDSIRDSIARLRRKLSGGGKPAFKQKRELFDALDVRVSVYRGEGSKRSKRNRRKVKVSYILSDAPLSIEYTSSILNVKGPSGNWWAVPFMLPSPGARRGRGRGWG